MTHETPGSDAFTTLERQLLTRLQWDFPLCPDPYEALAHQLGASRAEVYGAVLRLRATGVIRRIGGSFVPRQLGYVSVLVACRVVPERLVAVAEHAATFPNITHNYERDSAYNLWFTVIAEGQARLEAILEDIRGCAGVIALHPLPALKTFKIRVQFDLEQPATAGGQRQRQASSSQAAPSTAPALAITDTDRRLIPRCCGDIGEADRPFQAIADELQMAEAEVLQRLQTYKDTGALRRFGAILRHQAAGFTANGMSGWNVPTGDVERVAALIAACPEVSHCYERPPLPDWPYNLYGMIHGASREACVATATRLALASGVADYQILFSLREFKKSSMVYLDAAD